MNFTMNKQRYHNLTREGVKMCNFLFDLLVTESYKTGDYRNLDAFIPPMKGRDLFRHEQEKTQEKKMARDVIKCCATLSLRGLRDIVHLEEQAWIKGRLPLRLTLVKRKVLEFLSTECTDEEQASFWLAVGQAQRPIEHRRSMSFPALRDQHEGTRGDGVTWRGGVVGGSNGVGSAQPKPYTKWYSQKRDRAANFLREGVPRFN